jgi:hypothetical protein
MSDAGRFESMRQGDWVLPLFFFQFLVFLFPPVQVWWCGGYGSLGFVFEMAAMGGATVLGFWQRRQQESMGYCGAVASGQRHGEANGPRV